MANNATKDHRPDWACRQWGQYEHDWLDCPDCLAAYEHWLEQEHEGQQDAQAGTEAE